MAPDYSDNPDVAATFVTLQVLTFLPFIVIVAAIGTFEWKLRNLKKFVVNIPGPPVLPLIGNAMEFLGSPQGVFNGFYKLIQQYRYGSTFRVWIGPVLIVYVGKPADVQIILNSRHALEKASIYKFISEYFGSGLIVAPVETWRTHRKWMQPAFNAKLLEQYIPVFNKHNKKLVDTLKLHINGGQFDIDKYMTALSMDMICADHKLPAGCNVAISPLGLHMNPKIFPNPEQFNPENFTPENIARRHRYNYIPFSAGPRNCIGAAYGMLSMKTTIATLVRNYRFYTDMRTEDIKLRTDVLLRSTNGYPVRILIRK